jgi:CDP-2,3-bis-(O-geranylgeranyl)-sn-glycerol synthase
MLHSAAEALWFYLPALIANMAVYVQCTFVGDGIPIDLYGEIGGKRILGNSRTLLGMMGFFVFSLMVGAFQHRAMESLYLGMGANFGCILNSLIKRSLGLPRGKNVFPLDQTDHILGASLFYISRYPLDLGLFAWGLLAGCVIHLSVNSLRKTWELFVGFTG